MKEKEREREIEREESIVAVGRDCMGGPSIHPSPHLQLTETRSRRTLIGPPAIFPTLMIIG